MSFSKSLFIVGTYSLVIAAVAMVSWWAVLPLVILVSAGSAYILHRQDDRRFASERSRIPDPHDATNSERLSTVLSSMVDAVIAVDNSEHILFANPAAMVVIDTTSRSVIGRPIWEVIRNPTVQKVVREALAGTEQHAECEIPRTKQVLAIVSTPLDGDPCPGVVLVMHDVTRLRRLEAMRRDFVSNVSHELKTPLTVIQACTDTLLDGAIDDAEHNRIFLKRIETQSERLHRLILDLLKLAHVESEDAGLDFITLDPRDLIDECLSNHESIAKVRGVEIRAECIEPISMISGDHEGLLTILGNLVDNAIRYSTEGDQVVVKCRTSESTVVFDVVDNGSGIPSDRVERIFERFYRVDRARSREMGGTGLGLAIVKHLTQLHNGSVVCQSRLGEGSTFTVTLPAQK